MVGIKVCGAPSATHDAHHDKTQNETHAYEGNWTRNKNPTEAHRERSGIKTEVHRNRNEANKTFPDTHALHRRSENANESTERGEKSGNKTKKQEDRHENRNQTTAHSLHRRSENETESDHKQGSHKNGSKITSNHPESSPIGKSNKHRQNRKAEEKKDEKPKGGDKSHSKSLYIILLQLPPAFLPSRSQQLPMPLLDRLR